MHHSLHNIGNLKKKRMAIAGTCSENECKSNNTASVEMGVCRRKATAMSRTTVQQDILGGMKGEGIIISPFGGKEGRRGKEGEGFLNIFFHSTYPFFFLL